MGPKKVKKDDNDLQPKNPSDGNQQLITLTKSELQHLVQQAVAPLVEQQNQLYSLVAQQSAQITAVQSLVHSLYDRDTIRNRNKHGKERLCIDVVSLIAQFVKPNRTEPMIMMLVCHTWRAGVMQGYGGQMIPGMTILWDREALITRNCKKLKYHPLQSTIYDDEGRNTYRFGPTRYDANTFNTIIQEQELPFLLKMQRLTSLNLTSRGWHETFVTGETLRCLSKLPLLTTLKFEYINSAGTLQELANFPNIEELSLTFAEHKSVDNYTYDLQELRNCKQLRKLSLASPLLFNYEIHRVLFSNLGSVTQLRKITFEREHFFSRLAMEEIPPIEFLELHLEHLPSEGLISKIGMLTQLKTLVITNNGNRNYERPDYVGSFDDWETLQNLERLSLRFPFVSHEGLFSSLARLTNLRHLDIAVLFDCLIDAEDDEIDYYSIPQNFAQLLKPLVNLQFLEISSNEIVRGQLPDKIKSIQQELGDVSLIVQNVKGPFNRSVEYPLNSSQWWE